jgi:DNA (cytosine-5)-methyltransferase 1
MSRASRSAIIAEKLDRLREGASPRVLDLFAGCGGLSLGCQLAGAEIVGGIEFDPVAARSHALNFHRHDPKTLELHSTARDITRTQPLELIRKLVPRSKPRHTVDIIVGGPPCQAFARVGRAKLREIMEHPEAFLEDARAHLYTHYLQFVEALAPVAILVENVPDVLNYGGVNIFELMSSALGHLGYECRYGLLNSVHYGVPQMRDRAFLLAVAQTAAVVPTLPEPTHRWDLPRGYHGTRDVALRGLRSLSLFEKTHYIAAPPAHGRLRHAVSAEQALCDLPPITAHLNGGLKKAPQRFETPVRVTSSAPNDFVRLMRSWPGFESDGHVYDHVIRFLPRDYKLFARMKAGDQYPEAHKVALAMRDEAVAQLERARREAIRKDSREYRTLTRDFVPPYDPGKFPNKWRKMEADAPARTLMAHIGKDTYSHIHYDSSQARTISVREAARLQSFPDGFRFAGTMNPAFRQIGNAVPPLLANAVFSHLLAIVARRSFVHAEVKVS